MKILCFQNRVGDLKLNKFPSIRRIQCLGRLTNLRPANFPRGEGGVKRRCPVHCGSILMSISTAAISVYLIFYENVTLRNIFESLFRPEWETVCRHISTGCSAVEYLKYGGEHACKGMRILRSTLRSLSVNLWKKLSHNFMNLKE